MALGSGYWITGIRQFLSTAIKLHPLVCTAYNADFDGDQATTVGQENPKYHKYFITMCPTYAYIDRADGKFNRAMGFMKDHAALIATAWDLDTAYDNYLMDPEENSYDVLARMGLEGAETRTTRAAEISKLLHSSKTTGSFKERYVDITTTPID